MLDEAVFDDAIFGFHVQQTAEKSLKAWFSLLDITYPKIHDLQTLLDLLAEAGTVIPQAFLPLADYTDFAVQYRYDTVVLSEPLVRREAIAALSALLAYIERLTG